MRNILLVLGLFNFVAVYAGTIESHQLVPSGKKYARRIGDKKARQRKHRFERLIRKNNRDRETMHELEQLALELELDHCMAHIQFLNNGKPLTPAQRTKWESDLKHPLVRRIVSYIDLRMFRLQTLMQKE